VSNPEVVILGSGVMGLTVGRLLPGSVILEKSSTVGGYSRTLQRNNFYFDIGLHLLPRMDGEAKGFLESLLKGQLREIPVSDGFQSFLRDGRHWHEITKLSAAAAQVNPALSLGFTLSHLFRKMLPKNGRTFKDRSINHYGDLYYRFIARAIMQKSSGIPPDQLFTPPSMLPKEKPRSFPLRLARWAARSFKRPPRKNPTFYYPLPRFGSLVEKLAEGLNVRVSSEVTQIHLSGRRVVSIEVNRQTVPCKHLVCAFPLQDFIHLLGPSRAIQKRAETIRYGAMIYVVLFFSIPYAMRTLVAQSFGSEIFATVFEPKRLAEGMAPPGETSVCFEIRCLPEDPVWRNSDADLVKRILEDFRRYYEVPEPFDKVVFRLPRTAPIYDSDLEENLQALEDHASSFANIHFPTVRYGLVGPNTNNSVGEALRIARRIQSMDSLDLGGQPHRLSEDAKIQMGKSGA